jgi:hypothetical protein
LCSNGITIAGGENTWKIENIAHGRGTKAVARLSIVADYGEPCAIRCQREKDIGFQPVGVLILVDEDVVELRPHLCRYCGNMNCLSPAQQQIVIIEHVVVLFGSDIAGKKPLELGFPFVAPWVEIRESLR